MLFILVSVGEKRLPTWIQMVPAQVQRAERCPETHGRPTYVLPGLPLLNNL